MKHSIVAAQVETRNRGQVLFCPPLRSRWSASPHKYEPARGSTVPQRRSRAPESAASAARFSLPVRLARPEPRQTHSCESSVSRPVPQPAPAGRPHDIVFRLLRRQGRSRRLRMEPQHPASWILCTEVLAHDPRPHPSCGAELRHLLQQIVMRVEEEAQPRRKRIHLQPRIHRSLHVRHAIRPA